eukprot:5081796-Amphidinium_carterae.1
MRDEAYEGHMSMRHPTLVFQTDLHRIQDVAMERRVCLRNPLPSWDTHWEDYEWQPAQWQPDQTVLQGIRCHCSVH